VADSLREAVALWESGSNRAAGGHRALSGFSFQFLSFLDIFFRQVADRTFPPEELPQLEQVSDILQPRDGLYRLIQVKRTLGSGSLRNAVEELRDFALLGQDRFPDLLPKFRFQILCRPREQKTPPDVRGAVSRVLQVPRDDVQVDVLMAMFDPNEPVIFADNPMDRLSLFLWHDGVLDRQRLIRESMGLLMQSFDAPDLFAVPAFRSTFARELEELFRSAPRDGDAQLHFRSTKALGPSHFHPKEDQGKFLFDVKPRFEHLQTGQVRPRPRLLDSLIDSFSGWYEQLAPGADRLPFFGIGGRSGDGKSVLLLQLLAALVHSEEPPLIVWVSPGCVTETIRLAQKSWDGDRPVLIACDDFYQFVLENDLHNELQALSEYGLPHVAVLSCGPSDQLRDLRLSLRGFVEAEVFEVPLPGAEDEKEFADWIQARTKKRHEPSIRLEQKPTLMQMVFEMVRGESLPQFTKRIRARLLTEPLGVFEKVRDILVLNALGLPAPSGWLTPENDSHAIRVLETEQFHLVRAPMLEKRSSATIGTWGWQMFAHPTFAGVLVEELKCIDRGRAQFIGLACGNALTAFAQTGHCLHIFKLARAMIDHARSESSGDFPEIIETAYRAQLDACGAPLQNCLNAWFLLDKNLKQVYTLPGLFDFSLEVLRKGEVDFAQSDLRFAGGAWQWATRHLPDAARAEAHATIADILLKHPTVDGVVPALMVAGHDSNAEPLLRSWSDKHCCLPCAAPLLARLISKGYPASLGLRWLTANPRAPKGDLVIRSLMSRYVKDNQVLEAALYWIAGNDGTPGIITLVQALLARYPRDKGVADQLITWIQAGHPGAQHLLTALLEHRRDDRTLGLAAQWIKDGRPVGLSLLSTLLEHRPDDRTLGMAAQWIEDDRPGADHLMATLLAHLPDDQTLGLAAQWIEDGRPVALHLLATLLDDRPDDRTLGLAAQWIEDGRPGADHLLAVLLEHRPDDGTLGLAAQWIEDDRPGADHLMATLLAHLPNDRTLGLVAQPTAGDGRHPDEVHVTAQVDHHIAERVVDVATSRILKGGTESYRFVDLLCSTIHSCLASAESPALDTVVGGAYERALREIITHGLKGPLTAPDFPLIIGPLLRFADLEPRLRSRAEEWLSANETNPLRGQMLESFIRFLPESPETMERGFTYAADSGNPRSENVVSVMLHRSEASPKAVEFALAYSRNASNDQRRRVLFALRRVLAKHPTKACTAIECAGGTNRVQLLEALALGLKRVGSPPAGLVPSLAAQFPNLFPSLIVTLLDRCPDLEGVLGFARAWETKNTSHPEAGQVRRALRKAMRIIEPGPAKQN
jgi:hypothetical protein